MDSGKDHRDNANPFLSFSLPSSGISEQRDESVDSSVINSKEVNDGLLSILKCPVCLEFMVPPIHLCSEGHTVCTTCRPQITSCPTCKAAFAGRNFAMEKVAELVMYPCKYADDGCRVTIRLKDKKVHEERCDLRHVPCYFADCKWKGSKPDRRHHMEGSHRDKFIVGTNQVVHVELIPPTITTITTTDRISNWILSAFDEFFYINFSISGTHGVGLFLGAVSYLGPREKASKFYYTFRIKHHTYPNDYIEYTRTTHYGTIRLLPLTSLDDCFSIAWDVAKRYCGSPRNTLLPVDISVHKITEEKVEELVMYPCKYEYDGCRETVRLEDKKDHEEHCDFRTSPCRFPHCVLDYNNSSFLRHGWHHHLEDRHRDKLVDESNQLVHVDFGITEQNWMLSAHDELFIVSFRKYCTGGILGVVFYIGPQEKASKFDYTFRIKQLPNSEDDIVYTGTTHDRTYFRTEFWLLDTFTEYCFTISLGASRRYCSPPSYNSLPVHVSIQQKP